MGISFGRRRSDYDPGPQHGIATRVLGMGLSLGLALAGAAVSAPRANAADGSATFKLTRTYTGTGHGTADACVVTSANGFSDGDETASDDVVCTKDFVGYDIDFNIQMYDKPLSKVINFKPDANLDPYTMKGFAEFCTGQPQLWAGTIDSTGTHGIACKMDFKTTTDPAGVNLAGKLSVSVAGSSWLSGVTATGESRLQVGKDLSAAINNPEAQSVARGAKVVGTLSVDPVISSSTKAQPMVVGGKNYVAYDVNIDMKNHVPWPGSKTKGMLVPSDSAKLRLDSSTLPPGSVTYSSSVRSIPNLGISTELGYVGGSGVYNYVLIPAENFPTNQPWQRDIVTRILSSSTKLMDQSGTFQNLNGAPEPGSQADCSVDTVALGGAASQGNMPNNDCLKTTLTYAPPGNLAKKFVDGGTWYDLTGDDGSKLNTKALDQTGVMPVRLNMPKALVPDVPVYLCDEWEQGQQIFSGGVKTQATAADKMKLEYTASGRCSDATSASGWVSDPATLPGGLKSVRAIRYFSTDPVSRYGDHELSFGIKPNPDSSVYAPFDKYGLSAPIVDHMFARAGTGTADDYGNWRYLDGAWGVMGNVRGTSQAQPGQPAPVTFSSYHFSGDGDPVAHIRYTATFDSCARQASPDFNDPLFTYEVIPAVLGPSGQYCASDMVSPLKVVATAKHLPKDMGAYYTTRDINIIYDLVSPKGHNATTSLVTTWVEYPRSRATDTHTAVLLPAAIVNGSKTAEENTIETGDPVNWTVSWRNDTPADTGKVQWIDVLPYNGDGNGTRLRSAVELSTVTPSAGVTLEYTKTVPASVNNDPRDASNAAGGSTQWCAGLTGGSCPSSLSEVTAVRMTAANMVKDQVMSVKLVGAARGARNGDVLHNRVGVGVVANLAKEVPSPIVTTTNVEAATIEGTLWRDNVQDGVRGGDEAPWVGATVEALDSAGRVVGTTTTDDNGLYRFDHLHSGTYTTRVVRNAVLGDAVQTYSFDGKKFASSTLASSPITLARKQVVRQVDFGFAPKIPRISLSKQVKDVNGTFVERATHHWNSDVVWKITVTNNGGTPLKQVKVTDAQAAGCARVLADLAVGASVSYECTSTGVRSTIVNTAEVTATGTMTSAPAPGESATRTVTAKDDARVEIVGRASLALSKQITSVTRNGQGDYKASPELIRAGDVINYEFVVTNSGDVPITGVTLDDPKASDLVCEGAPDASPSPFPDILATCTGRHVLTDGDFAAPSYDNTAKVTGDAPDGIADPAPVEASASQPLARSASLSLTKSHLVDEKLVDAAAVNKIGQQVRWTFAVTNTGNRPVSSISISDPSFSGAIGCERTALMPGESTTCQAADTVLLRQEDADRGYLDNEATAKGISDGSGVTSNQADDRVLVGQSKPALGIVKVVEKVTAPDGTERTGSVDQIQPGDVIHWWIQVTNTGDVGLKDVKVTDPNAEGLDCGGASTLATGADLGCRATSVVTEADIVAGVRKNTAYAEGIPTNGAKAPDKVSDDAEQQLGQLPQLALAKDHEVADRNNGKGRPKGIHRIGDKITWTFVATNTGNVTVSDLEVSDPDYDGKVVCQGKALKPGKQTTCKGMTQVPLAQADVDAGEKPNVATIAGVTPTGVRVMSNQARTVVPAAAPMSALSLDKTITAVRRGNDTRTDYKAAPAGIRAGDVIVYDFAITNSGDIGLNTVALADPKAQDVTCPQQVLAVAETMHCTGRHIIAESDIAAGGYANTATATARSDFGAADPAPATDSATQPLRANAVLTLVKSHQVNGTGDTGTNRSGVRIRWTFVVTNAGNLPVRDLKIDDPDLVADIADVTITCRATQLTPGASTLCQADKEYTATSEDAARGLKQNTATARGASSAGAVTSAVARDIVRLVADQVPPTEKPGKPTPGKPGKPGKPGDPGNLAETGMSSWLETWTATGLMLLVAGGLTLALRRRLEA